MTDKEAAEPGRGYRNAESFTLEGPPVIFDHKHWDPGFTVDEEAAAAKGWKRGEHGWVKDVSDAPGRLHWVLEMESSETGAASGQFMQSWAGYERETLRLRVQIYRDGRIVIYPAAQDSVSIHTEHGRW